MARIRETPEGQKVEQAQADYNYLLESIRADNRLTPAGKRQQIAAAYLRAFRTVNEVKAKLDADKAKKIGGLRKDLFGLNGTADAQQAISFRDAQARAAELGLEDQEKALKLLDQAELSGDDIMVKALMQGSVELQWDQVANAYIDNHPYYGSSSNNSGIFSSQTDYWRVLTAWTTASSCTCPNLPNSPTCGRKPRSKP